MPFNELPTVAGRFTEATFTAAVMGFDSGYADFASRANETWMLDVRSGQKDWCGDATREWIPDVIMGKDISSACQLHDNQYGPESNVSRLDADVQLGVNVAALLVAQGVPVVQATAVGSAYFWGVRFGGGAAYKGNGSPF